jgi:hypothetical protein
MRFIVGTDDVMPLIAMDDDAVVVDQREENDRNNSEV